MKQHNKKESEITEIKNHEIFLKSIISEAGSTKLSWLPLSKVSFCFLLVFTFAG